MCFSTDILHGGHIRIINEAAKLGEVTIGILSDEAVASYRRYPLLSFEERKAIFGSVAGVARVVEQKELSYKEDIEIADKKQTYFSNKQFENRLFDRDTLLISHYDVNFLYVVSLYARNNAIQKDNWKAKVREMFRAEIQRILSEKFVKRLIKMILLFLML